MLEWNQIPFGWREALDIAVVAFLFYHVIRFVRGTRAMAAINGLFVLLVLYVVAQMVGLLTLVWLLENVFGSLFLVIVVLFHQDIRQALSSMSLRSLFRRRTGGHEELIRTLARTCCDLAAKRIGAIIVVEMTVPLGDMMEKGVKIDGQVSEDLLSTIFFSQHRPARRRGHRQSVRPRGGCGLRVAFGSGSPPAFRHPASGRSGHYRGQRRRGPGGFGRAGRGDYGPGRAAVQPA